MLNTAEHENCPANKSQIIKNCIFLLLNIAEHEHIPAIKYETEKLYPWGLDFQAKQTSITSRGKYTLSGKVNL